MAVTVDQEPHANAGLNFSRTSKTLILEGTFVWDSASPALAEQGREVKGGLCWLQVLQIPAEVTILEVNPWMDAGHWAC